MPNRIVHFEIEAKDKERAKKFYSDAFGWKMDTQPEEYGGYITVTTGDPKEPGGINGGIYQDENKLINAFSCVVAVDDIDKAIEDVKKAGGKVFDDNKTPDGKMLGEKIDIPGIGIYVKCEDTEGNRFTLLQPSSDMNQNK
ncbi:MAG TPA: VOC family protein [Candidatus Saccharimonadales bacterium]|nr:VOC family protein [Candidatus Saccharimonadales bacterium]